MEKMHANDVATSLWCQLEGLVVMSISSILDTQTKTNSIQVRCRQILIAISETVILRYNSRAAENDKDDIIININPTLLTW